MSGSAPSPAAAGPWTVRKVLEWTTQHLQKHGSSSPRLDAEVLLAYARGCQRIELYTNFEEPLTEAVRASMRELVSRRANAEPVAYLVGHREFYSLDFRVTKDVLIPRPETESLVMEALTRLKSMQQPRVLDLCTGSGCVAIAIARNHPQATVVATDVSDAALKIAAENAAKHGVTQRCTFAQGDLWDAVPADGPFHMIVSNPPYIPSAEILTLQPDVRGHEPLLALDGGADGLELIRRILAAAPARLVPGGWVGLEFTPEQQPELQRLLSTNTWMQMKFVSDGAGEPRIVLAQRAA